ncbi:MarR family winged helix-turn-helix transcriptional regulator [Actinomadura kijaniata]|uniref:MarR family winged helix-turn-helix transcriptional regulator n=1 Tax=Actinomadura kijaniata TaxID=46161 RepID=UPI00082A7D3D|nr:MarR family winged helix-turn-helix transcriptional regulator [Actinomadura kijaniata]
MPAPHSSAVADTRPAGVVELERGLTRVAHLLTRARQHDRTVSAAGVPVDRAAVPLLRLLAETGEPMRPGEIAQRLAVEAPHVTRQVQRLEKAGYLERVPDPHDRRAQRVRLLPAGHDAVEAIRGAALRWMSGALAHWPADDRERLAVLVNRMIDDFLAYSASECDHFGIAGPPGGPLSAAPPGARGGTAAGV